MIRIHKPATVPEKLEKEGKNRRRSHSVAYSKDPKAYISGAKKFTFDSSIYGHRTVRQALIQAQHGKCCFCERLIDTDGDVEHFRPKAATKQSQAEPMQRPGYYWLAYEWRNLYLACTGCNQRQKQALFPLENPQQRATHHQQDIQQERPLFIDPGNDEPETLIGFRGEVAYAIAGNPRGEVTIEALKLNGRSLPEARLQRLQLLKGLFQVVQIAADQPQNFKLQVLAEEAKALLEKARRDESEYAAAARSALGSQFQYVLG